MVCAQLLGQCIFLIALVSTAVLLHSVAIGQGTYRLGFSTSKSPMLLMSIPFLYGGIRSLYTKSNRKPPAPPQKLDGSSFQQQQQIESDATQENGPSSSRATREQLSLDTSVSSRDVDLIVESAPLKGGSERHQSPSASDSDGGTTSPSLESDSEAGSPTAQNDSGDANIDASLLNSRDSDSNVPSASSDSNTRSNDENDEHDQSASDSQQS